MTTDRNETAVYLVQNQKVFSESMPSDTYSADKHIYPLSVSYGD